MRLARNLLSLLAPLALGFAACGGGQTTILIDTFQFMPKAVSVKPGTMVTWTSTDTVKHRVTAGTPDFRTGAFDETVGPNGGTATVTFDQPGTFTYFCGIHTSMRGEMVVR